MSVVVLPRAHGFAKAVPPGAVESSLDEKRRGQHSEPLLEATCPPIVKGEHHRDMPAVCLGHGVVVGIHPTGADDSSGLDLGQKFFQFITVVVLLWMKRVLRSVEAECCEDQETK